MHFYYLSINGASPRSRVVLAAAVEQVIIVPSGCSLESFFAPHSAGEASPLSILPPPCAGGGARPSGRTTHVARGAVT